VHETLLDELYSEHIRTVARRTDTALAATGFDALVIHAGAPPMQFLDDQAYPYKVNPHFKAWVPIIDNPGCILIYVPGRAPVVLFHRPEDYWHKPASVPHAPWTRHVEIIPVADPAAQAASLSSVRARRSRTLRAVASTMPTYSRNFTTIAP